MSEVLAVEPVLNQPSGPRLPVLGPDGSSFTGGIPVVVETVPGPGTDQPFVRGVVQTPVGPVPRVTSRIEWEDRVGSFKARWDIVRMRFRVDPGLYALGCPDERSPVLVSANYKMSFDRLRAALPARSAWILVLDTDGINVWCSAGKGTFCTEEVIRRVSACRLAEVVSHRVLILPQLSAPGVAARRLRKACGFEAVFGPVRATDIPAFLDADMKATGPMRRVSFTLAERAAVMPVELVGALREGAPVMLAVFLLAGAGWPGGWSINLLHHGLAALTALVGSILAGAVITPLLLPWLPPRAFAGKGLFAGLAVAVLHAVWWWPPETSAAVVLELGGLALASAGLAAYMAMNFTGASTFTSLSGVRREIRWAVPVEIALVGSGLVAWIASRFLA